MLWLKALVAYNDDKEYRKTISLVAVYNVDDYRNTISLVVCNVRYYT
jgi:hypothetical protein